MKKQIPKLYFIKGTKILAFTVLQIFHLFEESCFFTTIHKLIIPWQVIMFSNMITYIIYFVECSLTLLWSCSMEQVGQEKTLGQAGACSGVVSGNFLQLEVLSICFLCLVWE